MWHYLLRAAFLPVKLLAGFDAFISYYRQDTTEYAEALHNELGRWVRPRVDLQDTRPSPNLPLSLRLAIARSKVLVVLNSPGAAGSGPVGSEVETFIRWSGGPVLPVELGCAMEEAEWWHLVDGCARIREDESAVRNNEPSNKVIQRILLKVGFWKVSRRQTLFLIAFAAILIGLTVAAWLAFAARDQARAERDAAATDARRRQNEAKEAEGRLAIAGSKLDATIHAARLVTYDAAIRQAAEALSSGELERARDALDSIHPKGAEEDVRGFEWYYLWRRAHPPAVSLSWPDCSAETIGLNHDGSLIAVGCRVRSKPGSEVRIMNTRQPYSIPTVIEMNDAAQILSVAFSPREDSLAVLWNMKRGKDTLPRISLLHKGPIAPPRIKVDNCSPPIERGPYYDTECVLRPAGQGYGPDLEKTLLPHGLSYSPDGQILLAYDAEITVYDWVGAPQSRRYDGYQTADSLRTSPKGSFFTVLGSKPCWGDLRGATAPPRNCVAGSVKEDFRHLAFAGEETLAAGGKNGITFFKLPAGDLIRTVKTPEATALASSFSGLVAAGAMDGTVGLWTVEGKRYDLLRGHTSPVKAVEIARDAPILASLGDDNVVSLWNIGEKEGEYETAAEAVEGLPSCDGRGLLRRMSDGLYQAPGNRILTLPVSYPRYPFVSEDCTVIGEFVPERDYLFSFFPSASAANSRKPYRFRGPWYGASTVTYSPDSHLAAIGRGLDEDEAIWVVDLNARHSLRIPQPARVASMAISNEGRLLAAHGDGGVRIWDVSNGKSRLLRAPTGSSMGAVAIDPTGRLAAWAPSSGSATISLLDLQQGGLTKEITASSREYAAGDIFDWALKFSPDGKTLALMMPDRTVTLIDTRTRSRLIAFDGPDFRVDEVRFTFDSRNLIFGGNLAKPPSFMALEVHGATPPEVFRYYEHLADSNPASEDLQLVALAAARQAYAAASDARAWNEAADVRNLSNRLAARLGNTAEANEELRYWSRLPTDR